MFKLRSKRDDYKRGKHKKHVTATVDDWLKELENKLKSIEGFVCLAVIRSEEGAEAAEGAMATAIVRDEETRSAAIRAEFETFKELGAAPVHYLVYLLSDLGDVELESVFGEPYELKLAS